SRTARRRSWSPPAGASPRCTRRGRTRCERAAAAGGAALMRAAATDGAAPMRAGFVRALGGPEQIQVGELPTPRPGPGEVLLAVHASSLNPVDVLVRSGAFPTETPFPFVLGRDAVGTVVEAGEGAEDLLGQRLATSSLGHDGRQGAWAEYTVVARERAYPVPGSQTRPEPEAQAWPVPGSQTRPVPEDVAEETLVAALHPASTAHLALHRHGGLAPG